MTVHVRHFSDLERQIADRDRGGVDGGSYAVTAQK